MLCVACLVSSEQQQEKKRDPSASLPPIHIENRLENIGNPSHDQSTRQTVTTPPPAREPELHPELELFDCKPTVIFYGKAVWREVDLNDPNLKDHPPNACIAIFRKKPVLTGQKSIPANGVTAHLTYRNEKGEQQIVNFGTWLWEYANRVDFVRGESHALDLSSSTRAGKENDGKTYVLDNPHDINPFTRVRFRSGMVIYAPDEKPMLPDCSEVEIALVSKNVTVYDGKFTCSVKPDGTVSFCEN